MKRTLVKFISLLIVICMVLSNSTAIVASAISFVKNASSEPFASIKNYDPHKIGEAKVDEASLLILVGADDSANVAAIPSELRELGVVGASTMLDITTPEDMAEAGYEKPVKWMLVEFDDNHKATEVAARFEKIPYVLDAEFNYQSETTAVPTAEEYSKLSEQYYINDDIKRAWGYLDEKGYMEKLSEVVVAVIDTGVDYTHPDLVNSMWVNANEIPDNGIDDDENGYIDDIYGAFTVGNTFDRSGNPMDDNGHGTHVAGIIAANGEMAGVAVGAKIMAVKAGQASGVFHDSDIIEAINYAVMMGADVINMSFGGYSRSAMVENALALAYSKAVLVAAAGNESLDILAAPVYPASYNYVLGVMALDKSGSSIASYSNTDMVRRNSKEYEVAALGTSMYSTIPNGEYATWSGTSMAAPYVSAIAAMLRAKLDAETYSTRYIMGQIAGTANDAYAVSAYDALTKAPTPDLSFFDYFIFDDKSFSEKNNGDGIADAGETIGLGIYIRNHWGQAREVSITLDALSVAGIPNPYITWKTDTVVYGDVGTFMTANNGITYDGEGIANGVAMPFVFELAENTPNSSALAFNVNMSCCTYEDDGTRKEFFFDENTSNNTYQNSFMIYSRKGIELPRRIDHDMTLTADNYYIISGSTLISDGVTVTVEPGTQLQFWGDYSKELYAAQDVANLHVDGTFNVQGTADNPVEIFPADNLNDLGIFIQPRENGVVNLSYANIANPCINATTIDHCYFYQNKFEFMCNMYRSTDGNWYHSPQEPYVYARTITNSKFFEMGFVWGGDYRLHVSGELNGNLFDSCGLNFSTGSWSSSTFTNNVFLKNSRLVESQYGDRRYLTSEFNLSGGNSVDVKVYSPVKNPITGSTYFAVNTGSYVLAEKLATSLGGHVVKADNYDELQFLKEYIDRYFGKKSEYYKNNERYLIDYFGIGFNAISDYNLEYIGPFSDIDWLNGEKARNYPIISVHYDDVSYGGYEQNRFNEEGMLDNWGNSYATIIELPGEPSLTRIDIDAGDALKLHTHSAAYQLTITTYPSNVMTDMNWASSNPDVATVDENGNVKPVGIGETVVTVTDSITGTTASITVTVEEYIKPESITPELSEINIVQYNGKYTLAPTILPANSTVSPIVWSSSDPKIASVSANGVVTALASGTATITGTIADEGLTVTYTVNVVIPVERATLSFDYTNLHLGVDNNKKIEVNFYPEYAAFGKVEFISHDTSVVTVDAEGVLTPVAAGVTVVEVKTQYGNSVYCVVNVIEKTDETKIVSVNGDDYSYSVFYAQDGTAWMLSDYNHSYEENIIPEKLPVKVKFLQRYPYYGGWLYIDENNNLCTANSLTFDGTRVIDTDVSFIEKQFGVHSQELFYVKTDGTVWYMENFHSDTVPQQVLYLSSVVDMALSNGYHLFIDTAGALWTMESNADIKKPTSFVKVETDAKMVAFPENGMCNNYTIIAEGGQFYRFYNPDNFHNIDFSHYYDYTTYADRIVKYAPYREDVGIALLDDGTAVYYGNRDTLRNSGLVGYIEEIPTMYSIFVPIANIDNIVDIGADCFILADGNVMTFNWDGNSKPLGNNTSCQDASNIDTPVYAWFGVTSITNEEIIVNEVEYSTESGKVTCTPDKIITGVNNNAEIVIKLNRAPTTYYTSYITLTDEFGYKIDATVDISYVYITITPKEALKAGYEYTIDIPSAILSDFFGNENDAMSLHFIAAGTAVYPIPVTGITDENTDIKLGYNESLQLTPTIVPTDAYKKTILWSVADESVATVDANGVVTAINNGTTKVTATTVDGNFTLEYTVTVRIEIESVALDNSYLMLGLAEKNTATVRPIITPSNAVIDSIVYQSTDESIATIDQNGNITAIGSGAVVILVKVNGNVQRCLVNVIDDLESAKIDSVYSDSYMTVYYAADGTTWIVDNNYSEYTTPRKFPVKTKSVIAYRYNSLYVYIDTDDNLYRVNSDFTNATIIDTDVKFAEQSKEWNSSMFYVKNDGTVWYLSHISNAPTQIDCLSGITDIAYYNGYHVFIDADGSLWTIKSDATVTEAINYNKLTLGDVKFASIYDCYIVLDESGNVYQLNSIINENYEPIDYSTYANYDLYKDKIVKYAFTNSDYGFALLDDGSVVYFGYKYNCNSHYFGLNGYFPTSNEGMESYAFMKLGFENVKDIGRDCVVFEDGRVLAFRAQSEKILGDGTKREDILNLNSPVTPLFGIDMSREVLHLEGYKVNVNGTNTEYGIEDRAENVNKDTAISLIFNTAIIDVKSQYIMVADEFGRKVAVEVSIDGRTLVIKPLEPLKDGIQYTVTIPNGIMTNYFGNSNIKGSIVFSVEGTAVYDIPVTGVTAGTASVTMSKDESIKLSVTVTPDDATQKRINWSSSDTSVAVVSANGTVTAKSDGTAVITAQTVDGGHTVEITVSVFTTVLKDSVNIALGSDMNTQLIYKAASTEQSITWASADPAIAAVDANGKLTPVSAGITSVYVYADGTAIKNFVVSVLPDETYLKVQSVGTNGATTFTYITEKGVWVLNGNYMFPKFVEIANVVDAVAYDRELVVRLADNTVKQIYVDDGSVYENSVLENVVQMAYRSNMVWALTSNGSLYYRSVWNSGSGWTKYEYIENAKQISISKSYHMTSSYIYILDDNGYVWRANYSNAGICELYEDEIKIVDINVCDGLYMKDVNGKLYNLYYTERENNDSYTQLLEERGFYSLGLDGVDMAVYSNTDGFVMLLSDGSLAYFGHAYAEIYEAFKGIATVEQSSENSYLYYIKGLPAVKEIGAGYILLENGNVVMCVRNACLGDGTGNTGYALTVGTPRLYYTERPTTLDTDNVTINGTANAFNGNSSLSVNTDVAEAITVTFSNPLVLSEQIKLISLKNSAGETVKTSMKIDRKSVVITVEGGLISGETYILVVPAGILTDIFSNTNERREATIKVAGSASASVTIYDESVYPTTDYSPDYTKSEISDKISTILRELISEYAENNSTSTYNAILNTLAFPDTTNWMMFNANSDYRYFIPFANNFWGTTNTEIIDKMIFDVNDNFERAEVIYTPFLTADQTETMYPFVTSISVLNSEGEKVSQVGIEEITVVVKFNRDMDTTLTPFVGFGGDYPYGDFQLDGEWTDARTWQGKFNITAVTGSGVQYFKVLNAVAADDKWLTTGNDYERFAFTISTYGAKSMTLNAVGNDGKVDLEWAQDDFDTLMGYNIYRSENKDADVSSFTKLNSTVISNSKTAFADSNVEQGKTYYYYFTVVQTDFSESDPSSVVEATVNDTSAPEINHNSISEAAVGGNIAIIARVYDNIAVRRVTLYYLNASGSYAEAEMLETRDQYGSVTYVASIPGSAVGTDGVKYYIEASDGYNTAYCGTVDRPNTIKTYVSHQISVNSYGGGRISVSKSNVKAGETVYVTLTPYEGFKLVPGTLTYTDSKGTHTINGNSFVMPAEDISISAEFREASQYSNGDVNRDGIVDSADAVLILRYDAGLFTLDSEQQIIADINEDGYINVADAAEVLRIDAGY